MSGHAVLGVLGQKKWTKFLVENSEMGHARTTVGEVIQLYKYMGAANGQPRARLNKWLGREVLQELKVLETRRVILGSVYSVIYYG